MLLKLRENKRGSKRYEESRGRESTKRRGRTQGEKKKEREMRTRESQERYLGRERGKKKNDSNT